MHHSKLVVLILAAGLPVVLSGCADVFKDQSTQTAIRQLGIGNTDQAIETLNAIVAANPKDSDAYLIRSTAYLMEDKSGKAIEDCSAVLKIDPKNYRAFLVSGLVKLSKNLSGSQAALSDFDSSVRYTPKQCCPYLARVIARYQLGNLSGAGEDVQQAVALNPQDSLSANILAQELQLLDFREQAKLFQKIAGGASRKDVNQLLGFVNDPLHQKPPSVATPALDPMITGIVADRLRTLQDNLQQQQIQSQNQQQQNSERQTRQQLQQSQQDTQAIQNQIEQQRQEIQRREQQVRQQQMQQGMQELQNEARRSRN